MSRSLRLHPAARRELDEAAAYYDVESPGLGSAFLSEFDHALQQIRAFPEAAPDRPRIGARPRPLPRASQQAAVLLA